MDEQTTPTSDNNVSNALGNLLSNPALLQSIGTILGSTSAENTKDTSSVAPQSLSSDGLSKVLADPDLMAKLPQVMAVLQPMLSNPSPNTSDTTVPAIASHNPNHPRSDCRDDLLIALKPFLSPARCEAVDTIIRLSKLGHVLKHLQ